MPFALLLGFSFGAALALASRRSLMGADEGVERQPTFIVAAGYGALVLAPVVAYGLAFHGDWALLYALPSARVPSAVDLVIVVLAAASVPAGVVLATARLRAGDRRGAVVAAAAPAAVAALAALLFVRRLVTSATWAQWKGHYGGETIVRAALGRAVVVCVLGIAAGALVAFRAVADRDAPSGR